MALLESLDIPLGSPIEHFQLIDPFGKMYSSNEIFGSKGLLIVFTCNHCPYAIAVWPRLVALAAEAKVLGIETVAVNPNINTAYPDDAPENMKKKIEEWKIPFPYLVDEQQAVARTFRAQCTPDIYLFGSKNTLVYHGRIDDNWQDASKVQQRELREAIINLAAGNTIAEKQYPSMGCSIKWRG